LYLLIDEILSPQGIFDIGQKMYFSSQTLLHILFVFLYGNRPSFLNQRLLLKMTSQVRQNQEKTIETYFIQNVYFKMITFKKARVRGGTAMIVGIILRAHKVDDQNSF